MEEWPGSQCLCKDALSRDPIGGTDIVALPFGTDFPIVIISVAMDDEFTLLDTSAHPK